MSQTTTADDRQTDAKLYHKCDRYTVGYNGRLIIVVIYQLVIQQLSVSIENSFSSLLLHSVQILEVQKRPIVHYCALLQCSLDTS